MLPSLSGLALHDASATGMWRAGHTPGPPQDTAKAGPVPAWLKKSAQRVGNKLSTAAGKKTEIAMLREDVAQKQEEILRLREDLQNANSGSATAPLAREIATLENELVAKTREIEDAQEVYKRDLTAAKYELAAATAALEETRTKLSAAEVQKGINHAGWQAEKREVQTLEANLAFLQSALAKSEKEFKLLEQRREKDAERMRELKEYSQMAVADRKKAEVRMTVVVQKAKEAKEKAEADEREFRAQLNAGLQDQRETILRLERQIEELKAQLAEDAPRRRGQAANANLAAMLAAMNSELDLQREELKQAEEALKRCEKQVKALQTKNVYADFHSKEQANESETTQEMLERKVKVLEEIVRKEKAQEAERVLREARMASLTAAEDLLALAMERVEVVGALGPAERAKARAEARKAQAEVERARAALREV